MKVINIRGINYQIGKLNTRQQLHLLCKIAPAIPTLGLTMLTSGHPADETKEQGLPFVFAIAFANYSDADRDEIVNRCLGVCKREEKAGAGSQWADVLASGTTRLMYEDIELPEQIKLCIAAIKENLGSFFPIAQPQSPAQPSA